MAIFNNNADPVAAVAAFLGQFSLSNTGAIRYAAGDDTFHVTWLHRSLQHKVWEFSASGDDDGQLSDPNPSTTAALGQIIRLLDQTPSGFSQRYNIDDEVGLIEFYLTDKAGNGVIDRNKNEVVTATAYGRVQIKDLNGSMLHQSAHRFSG